jgi:hypothetical protein
MPISASGATFAFKPNFLAATTIAMRRKGASIRVGMVSPSASPAKTRGLAPRRDCDLHFSGSASGALPIEGFAVRAASNGGVLGLRRVPPYRQMLLSDRLLIVRRCGKSQGRQHASPLDG